MAIDSTQKITCISYASSYLARLDPQANFYLTLKWDSTASSLTNQDKHEAALKKMLAGIISYRAKTTEMEALKQTMKECSVIHCRVLTDAS